MNLPFKIHSLGDSAITIEYGNCIDEKINNEVIARFNQLNNHKPEGILDIIPAYSSLTIYYDLLFFLKKIKNSELVFDHIKSWLEKQLSEESINEKPDERLVRIPVCYDPGFAPDLESICIENKIDREELIRIHTTTIYKIYMLGFLPGFAYMGEVDERIASPRKKNPQTVIAGSVGIAGKQTGIYPLDSPGGWKIIGRTPLKLFDPDRDQVVLLRAGDRVQFYQVDQDFFSITDYTDYTE